MFFYFFYKLGEFIVKSLPLNNAYKLAEWVSRLRYYFSIQDRRIICQNLRVVLEAKGESIDEEKIEKLAREVYKNFGRYLVEFFKFPKIDKEFIDRYVDIVGDANKVNRLFKNGEGVICVSAHLGNWELVGGMLLSSFGFPVNAIALPHTSKLVSHFFDNLRISKGVKVIPTGMAIKRCFKALKKNELVGFLGDKDFSGNGIMVRFFGKETIMPKGPAVISLKTQSPIVLIFFVRGKDERFKLIIEEVIQPTPLRNEEDEVRLLTQRYVNIIEKYIKEYPTQWLMFHKIWSN